MSRISQKFAFRFTGHINVKRGKSFRFLKALEQATRDRFNQQACEAYMCTLRTKNPDKGILACLQQAADSGCKRAAHCLGHYYHYNQINVHLAIKYYKQAIELGDIFAVVRLSELCALYPNHNFTL